MTSTLPAKAAAMKAPSAAPARTSRARGRRLASLIVLLLVLAVIGILSLVFGAREVSWHDIVSGVTGSIDTAGSAAVNKRVPRTILAVLVGAALAVAGAVLQGATRNPLADPQILGINGGAALAVVTGIAFFGLSATSDYIWIGMIGSACAAFLVSAIGSAERGAPRRSGSPSPAPSAPSHSPRS